MTSPDIAHAIHQLRFALTELVNKHNAHSLQIHQLDEKLNVRQTSSASDPVLLKRIGDLEDKLTQTRETMRGLSDELRTMKAYSKDTSAIETSLSSKLEQYVTKLVKEKSLVISDETKALINHLKQELSVDADTN